MFEHVGKAYYGTFMQKAAELLKPSGLGLLHTIGERSHTRVIANPWFTRYIFPGSRLPRLHEITEHIDAYGMTVGHVENLKMHYAATLRHWKENFDRNKTKIAQLGPQFNETFLRMWNYYLQSCEAGFRSSTLQLYQVLLAKRDGQALPKLMRFEAA